MAVFAFGAILAAIVWLVTREWPAGLGAAGLALLALVTLLSVVFYTQLRYDAWRYAIREHDVLVCYGVWWRTQRCIPRLRIQHVDIDSGPIDRALGLARLSLFTAGTISSVASLPGLTPREAEELRQELLSFEGANVQLARPVAPGHDRH
jgi:membrane protein YdbS with pleckstrin-like domain